MRIWQTKRLNIQLLRQIKPDAIRIRTLHRLVGITR